MIKKYQLRNGIKVFLQQSHRSPVASVQVWVRTGSADEGPGEEGLTHFIEHLLFKGTRKYKTAEIAKMIEGAGGELNAYTSFDQTVYYITISSKYIELAIDALGEMLGAPLFDPNETDNEREVVLEEIKRSNDSPGRLSGNLLFSTVYKKHPYGRPVIGYPEVIKQSSVDKIKKLFYSRYSPQNVLIVVAGDFELDKVKKSIDQHFSKVTGKLKIVNRNIEPVQEGPRISVSQGNNKEAYINLAWKLSAGMNRQIAELDMLSILLGAGDSSRLVQRLRLEEHIVNSIGASLFYSLDPGFFSVSATLNIEALDLALDRIAEAIFELKTEKVMQKEIESAIVNLESSEIYGVESVENLASKIGRFQHLFGDPLYFKKYLKQIKKVKPDKILMTSRQLLNTNNLSITALVPGNVDEVKKKLQDWIAAFEIFADMGNQGKILTPKATKNKKLFHKSLSEKSTGFKKLKLKNGGQLILKTNTETDVISVQAGFLGGVRAEPRNVIGLSELLASSWATGTSNKNERELIDFIESRAASVRPFAGRNSIGISFDFLKDFESDMAELFEELLISPAFSENVIEREKKVQIENIKSQLDRPSQLVYYDFMEKLFGSHPYCYNPIGNENTVAQIDRDLIDRQFKKLVNNENATFVVSGAASEKLWHKTIDQVAKKVNLGKMFNVELEDEDLVKSEQSFRMLQKEQSHIIYGFKGLKMNTPEKYTLQVIQSVLSGQGGRLFYNLRERASLAYSVSPIRMEGIERGCFGVYIGCSPEKAKKSIEMIQSEFEHLIQNRISDGELERSKKYLIGRHDIGLQRTSAVASSILFNEIYGVKSEEVFTFSDLINAVSSDDILELSHKLFTKHHVISVVGPQNPF